MAKLAVVLLSDMNEPVKVEMAMRYTLLAKGQNKLEDIRFFFFGPGVRVPGQVRGHETLGPVFEQLMDSGVAVLACVFNAHGLGEEANLGEAEVEARAIGEDLTEVIDQGYQVMTF